MVQLLNLDFNANLLSNHFTSSKNRTIDESWCWVIRYAWNMYQLFSYEEKIFLSKICLTIDVTTWMMHWVYILTLLYKNYSHKSLSNVGKLISNTNHYILISLKIRSVAENKCKKRKYTSKLQHLNDIIILIYMQFETFSKRIIFATNQH